MRAYFVIAAAAFAASAAGCDPSADASGAEAGQSGASAELESCAATSQCQPGLRCVDRVCVPEVGSVLGDYHAATGRLALERGDVNGAIERFSRAVNQYESDGITPPAALYCEQGHALVADRTNPERAEVGARVLHRCLLRAPAASDLQRRALTDLALLDELGLEPLTLNRAEPADAYLTREARPLRPDELRVAVSGEGRARTFNRLISHLEGENLDETLAPCWNLYFDESGEEELTLEIPFSYDYRLGPTTAQDRAVVRIPNHDGPSGSGEAKAHACAVDILKPMAAEYARRQSDNVGWREAVTLQITPAD